MKKKFQLIFMILIICIFPLSFATVDYGNINVSLLSDKQIYSMGEDVNLTLKIENNYNQLIQGQIKGKVIIGDIGYEIQCFDYNALPNDTKYLGLTPLPASLSNSNTKTMTTLYACSGTQMQSTKTIMSNNPVNQNGEENFQLGPFIYSYNFNGTDFEAKSNILNITVSNSQNGQQSQQSQQSQSNQQTGEQSGKQSNSQSQQSTQNNNVPNSQLQSQSGQESNQQQSPNGQQSSGLNSQNQQALSNNQQNAQSVNQLKNQINDVKNNPLNTQMENDDKNNFWMWFTLLFFVIFIMVILYFKNLKEEPINEEIIKEEKPTIPKYFILLDEIKLTTDEKNKAVLLSQSIREFIIYKNKLNKVLTHSEAIELTKNKLFIQLLKDTQLIEFAKKNIKLNYDILIKKLKQEMKNG